MALSPSGRHSDGTSSRNLTTQTNSTRGFTILLLGRYLVERAIEDGRIGRELALDAFLRFEQIGAYVRHVAHGVGGDIRGIERVRSKREERRGLVPIRADPDGFILGDQRVNGLWGLFSVPARVSCLIPDGPVGLTAEAMAFVEREYLPILQPIVEQLSRLVARGGRLDTRTPDAIFSGLSKVLSESFTEEEQHFYGEYLRDGLHVRRARTGLQRTFRELLVHHVDLDAATGRTDVVQLHEAARSVDEELANHLDRIGPDGRRARPCDVALRFHADLPSSRARRNGGRVDEALGRLGAQRRCGEESRLALRDRFSLVRGSSRMLQSLPAGAFRRKTTGNR